MVKAAYSSGKPAFGVGPGNVPVLVDTSADVEDAIAKIVAGKSFDYGTVCSSEQAIVAESGLRDRILGAAQGRTALPLQRSAEGSARQAADHAELDGESAVRGPGAGQDRADGGLRSAAGHFDHLRAKWPAWAKQHPLSAEKLSPVLSLYFVADFAAALDTCYALLHFGGTGHTAVIHAKNDARIREYGLRMPAMRVLVNTPAPQGSTGITTNVFPAMTLGCGAVAGNITSDNVGPQHLINIKRLAYAVRKPEEAFEMPLDIDAAPAGVRCPGSHARRRWIARRWSRRWSAISPRADYACNSQQRRAGRQLGKERSGRRGGPLPGAKKSRPRACAAADTVDWTLAAPPETGSSTGSATGPRRLRRWISSAKPTCARPSARTARSTSGRRHRHAFRPRPRRAL